jgi:hypothetical protein
LEVSYLFFNLVLVVVFLTLIFYYSCDAGAV